VIFSILLILSAVAMPAEEPAEDPLPAEAAVFCKIFLEGDFDRLQDRMTPGMKSALTPQLSAQVRDQLLESGEVVSIGDPWLETATPAYRRYRVPVRFENATVDLRVVFDHESKVAGFFHAPHVEPPSERAALSQEPAPEFLGHWEGAIELPGSALTVIVDLAHEDGSWSGTADIPMQGAKGLPLTGIAAGDGKIEFALADIPGDPTFRGELSDGRITGTFTQGGQSFPFGLGREAIPEPARPQEPEGPLPYEQEEVSYTNGEIRLAGTLTFPSGGAPFPAAILISGSGPQDRNEEVFGHKPFLVLSDHLTRAGIAVLRVDDRGVGGSGGSVSESTTEDFAGDVLAGIAFLRDREEVDPKRIGLIGHSEGGIIAPLVAAESDEVAYVITLAGPGVPGDEILYRQTQLIARASGVDEQSLAGVLEAHRELTSSVKSGAEEDEIRVRVRALIEAQLGEAESDAIDTAVEQTVAQMTGPWFRFFLGYDPRPALGKVRVPVLALNGELDLQVDPDQNLPEIRKALEQGGNEDFTVEELPGLNHLFQTAESGSVEEYYTLEETLSPVALDAIRDWILARFGAPEAGATPPAAVE
jgi:pimeloyl-ACP methyl ester carboxylesterase